MIQSYFLPKSGGGWLRRFWQFRSEFLAKQIFLPDGRPLTPLTLFDFRRPVDFADAAQGVVTRGDETDRWRISDDGVIGGFSTSSAVLIQSRQCWAEHLAREMAMKEGQRSNTEEFLRTPTASSVQEDSPPEEQEAQSEEEDEENFTPYIRWYGNLDTHVPLSTKAQRSGFSALRSPEFAFDGADLQGYYNGLEIQCRERIPRIWNVQVKLNSIIEGDIYQGTIVFDQLPELPAGTVPNQENRVDDDDEKRPFETFVLMFENLLQTAYGRPRHIQRELTGGIKINSIGFALMDGVDGPFELDVARVRAVNILDDGFTVYEEGTKMREREAGNRWNPF